MSRSRRYPLMRGGSDKWSRTRANRLLRQAVRDAIRHAGEAEPEALPLLREVSNRYVFASDGASDAWGWFAIDPERGKRAVVEWGRK